MPAFENRVVRLNDAGAPRYRVEFIGDQGQSVAVECLAPQSDGEEPSRDEIIEQARKLAGEAADPGEETPARTYVGATTGLSRPVDETEGRTHSSEGRDRGTE